MLSIPLRLNPAGWRRPLMRVAALVAAAALAACEPVEQQAAGPQTGPTIDPSQPVQVALLVPGGSGDANYDYMARSMANAARMAVADAQGARIDLRVYDYGDDAGPDSRGLFQQRPSQGWGTEEQVMDPVYASNAFYDGLVKVPAYESMEITQAAQAVQRSAFHRKYCARCHR